MMSDKKNNFTEDTYMPESMNVEPQACNSCMTYCQTSCETMCQTGCEVNCQTTCQKSCQNCQGRCESTCQKICQTNCERLCQSACEIGCMSTCEKSCQNACESSCQSSCQKICQTNCERLCQSTCEIGCMSTCERNCQNCEGSCQSSCQRICQENCERLCQDYCEVNCLATCQVSCQNCEGRCEAACEKSCQNCEGRCEDTCEKSCQNCEGVACQTCQNCEGVACQTCQNCEGVACQTCQNCEGVACQSCQNCEGVACQSCQSCQTNCEVYCQNSCEHVCLFGGQLPTDEHINLTNATEEVPIKYYNYEYIDSNPQQLKIKIYSDAIRKELKTTRNGNLTTIDNYSLPFNQRNTKMLEKYTLMDQACPVFALATVMTYYSKILICPTWLHFTDDQGILWYDSLNMIENKSENKPALKFNIPIYKTYTSDSLDEIKNYIDSGVPVIIYCSGKNSSGSTQPHWVAVYGYKNNCDSINDLYVMDSFAENRTNFYGNSFDLAESMNNSKITDYEIIRYVIVEENI